ncbi:MAG: 4-hydroxy-4-methyl-2-oxoglutarate aldolase [Thermomicrobiales bacterium]|nr:4-hydroxy-4-methyl-2-oxoglutarate aldolase [Thermomicrobiales bacterium]
MSAKARLTDDQLEALRRIDSPTIANAIETFEVRPHSTGFMGLDVQPLTPELGVMVGYAVTVTCDSQTDGAPFDVQVWWDVLKAIEASPKPVVLVFQDDGPRPSHACHFGDGMATIASRLGAIGLVTNGGVRDLSGVRALGFRFFAAGVVVSHGNFRLVSGGHPVEVSGVRIEPGDLIHADENGVVLIPAEVADRVAEAAQAVLAEEAELIGYYRGESFSLEKVGRRMGITS